MKRSLFFAIIIVTFLSLQCMQNKEATWKTIPEIKQTEYEKAWAIIVGAISERFDLEVIDANSGYLRSAWKENKDWLGSKESRTRVVVRITSREPLKVKLKVEEQKWDALMDEWKGAGNNEKIERELLEEFETRLK